MTDLEITRLCAKALEIYPTVPESYSEDGLWCFSDGAIDSKGFDFNPLTDDAQAMAMVQKFRLSIDADCGIPKAWQVASLTAPDTVSADLNRAICECVAKMQAAKGTA